MSDSPFADLFASFKHSWDAAGNVETFSAQRVRSRPSFWNPFHTWRDEEQRELRQLYEEVKAGVSASPFSRAELLNETTETAVVTICDVLEIVPPHDVLLAFHTAISELIGDEFFSFQTFERDDWANRLDMEAASQLKQALERQRHILSDADHLFEVGCHKITTTFCALIELLPEGFRNDENGQVRSGSMSFGVDLVDIINGPEKAIAGALTTLFDKDMYEGELFADVQAQLEHNTYVASGLDPGDRTATEKQLILPMDKKGLTPGELAELYLKQTPFADFFSSSLSLKIPDQTRFEHCHILGGTGHGKTQCLQYLLLHDLGRAVEEQISIVVIDSQGDLIRKIHSNILFRPDHQLSLAKRFVMIDPSDIEHPPALNLFDPGLERMENYSPRQRELTFNSLVDIYGRFFGSLLGAELTARQSTVFRYLARLMLAIKGATIHTLIELMDDIAPFKSHIEKLDPTARLFFKKEFSQRGFNATRQQIKHRLYAVLSIPTFDRLFSAPKSKINFFDAINGGKIVLVNTSKDLLKQDGTAIFGRFILALIEHAVMERATLPEDERSPVFLYMDEAQDYFDDTVETLLVQARKFNCGLILAHQNLAQLSPRLRAVFMGNTTIKLVGGVSDSDARAIAPDMHTSPDFLLSMKKRKSVSDFALSVRNLTSRALKVGIPLGFLESYPVLEPEQHNVLLEGNRKSVGYVPRIAVPRQELVPAPPSPPTQEPEPASVAMPETATGHRELQDRIKQAAQKSGFFATIEQQVLNGKGRVDVALERDGMRIACEVSVTTRLEHEQHNIEKCLAAGYEQVWVTSPDSRQLAKLRAGLLPTLPAGARERVFCLSEDELIAQLEALTTQASISQTKVLGYEVKIMHTRISPLQAMDRRARLAAVLLRERRPTSRDA
jgi:Helicase HerA, central domain